MGLSDATSPNPTFTPTVAGTTTYTLTKTDGGCSSIDQVTITVTDYTIAALTSPTVMNTSQQHPSI